MAMTKLQATSDQRVSLAIQLKSKHGFDGGYSLDERAMIVNDFSPEFQIHWLPPYITKRTTRTAYGEISEIIFLFVAGGIFLTIAKPFFETVGKEAGKDFWQLIKRLSTRLWSTRTDKSYALKLTICIVLELNHDFVAIELSLPRTSNADSKPIASEREIQAVLEDLAMSWDSIREVIQKFSLGERPSDAGKQVHIISRVEDRWVIHPYDSDDFF